MKKIVISANTSWYLYNFRKNTILELIEQGYKVLAVAPLDEYSRCLKDLGCDYLNVDIDQSGTNPIKDVLTFISFYQIYKAFKPDVVLNFTPKNNIYSTLAAKLVGASIVNNIAGLGSLFIDGGIRSRIARYLYKFSQSKANKIFFQNGDDCKLFLEHNLAPHHLTAHLPGSGVDLQRFSCRKANDDGVIRFLLVARMLFDKGVGYYVDAARILKAKYGDELEFRLLGFLDVDNPSAISESQMQEWVEEGCVIYLGTSDTVEEEIAKVDCMVLPSFYREGVPKSLLEAGAMAKPIVTTDNVGCRETVDDGVNGFLCEPRSTISLVEKLEAIIQMTHSERLAMGECSRRKIKTEFDEKIVIQRYISTIAECLRA